MILAHYASTPFGGDAGWLEGIEQFADGRAAPLFCVVLGVGSGLYLRRRTAGALARRALVLLALGLLVWPHVEHVYLILPHYGLLLAFVAVVGAHLPDRALLPLAAGAWAVPTAVVTLTERHGLRDGTEPDRYGDLLDVAHVVWQLLWTGGYPVVGWLGFALLGLWLGRRDLGDPPLQLGLVGVGAALALTQVLTGGVTAAGRLAPLFDSTAHSNQLAWYVAAAGSSIAVLGLCLLLTDRFRLRPLVLLGRLALSLYLLHLVIGSRYVWPWRDRHDPGLAPQLLVVAATIAGFLLLAGLWSRRFASGPVEAAVRRLAG